MYTSHQTVVFLILFVTLYYGSNELPDLCIGLLHLAYSQVILQLFYQNYRTLYLGHLRGIAYPSSPGLRGMLEMVLRQEQHWMVMLVALARIAEALIMIPGIFTSLAICSD